MPIELDGIPQHLQYEDKSFIQLWSPIVTTDGAQRRLARNVALVTALVLDLDTGDDAKLAETLSRIAQDGLEHWAYTTHSHSAQCSKWRIVLPLATPVPGSMWKRVWAALVARYAPWTDTQCCDPCRAYYFPSCPPEQAHLACVFQLDGALLDWTAFPIADEPPAAVPVTMAPGTRRLTDEQLADLIVAVGEGFPELGERHELALALGGALRRELICDEHIELVVSGGFAMGGSNKPDQHARTALHSAGRAAQGDPTYGWPTVTRVMGSGPASAVRALASAARASIDVELLRPKPAPALAWPDPESRAFAPLDLAKNGMPVSSGANLGRIFDGHPAWSGVLAYDELSEAIVCLRRPPVRAGSYAPVGKLNDATTIVIGYWFSDMFGINVSKAVLVDAILATAQRNRFNPVRDYLRGLKWDGTRRLENFLHRYLGADDTEYTRIIGRKFLISCVARGWAPGCKVDTMMILEGTQGIYKSTAIRILCGEQWFSDSKLDFNSKDAAQNIRGRWIVEIPELNSFKRAEMATVKAFVTSPVDRFRPSYGRFAEDFPRSSVFVGTTNEQEYLSDDENRRYWPVTCHSIDLMGIAEDRDQLWAEAVEAYLAGEKWYLERGYEEQTAKAEQAKRQVGDPWSDLITDWIAKEKPQEFFLSELMQVLQIPSERQSTGTSQRLGHLLKVMGFHATKRREPGVGIRKCYRPSQSIHTAQIYALPSRGSVRQAGGTDAATA